MSEVPLTIVSAARNDGYGERFADRFAFHCSSVDGFAEGLGTPVEHVLVDWNPVEGAPLADLVPASSSWVTRTVLQCSGDAVNERVESRGVPFVEAAAKNAGVLAAGTEWVCLVNSDVALSYELGIAVSSLMHAVGGSDVFLRADRLDIEYAATEALPDRVEVADALSRATVLHRRHGDSLGVAASVNVLGLPPDEIAPLASCPRPTDLAVGAGFLTHFHAGPTCGLHTNASGDFLVVRKATFLTAGGLDEAFPQSTHLDSLLIAALAGVAQSRQIVASFPAFVVHVDHDRGPGYGTGSVPFSSVQEEFDRLLSGWRG